MESFISTIMADLENVPNGGGERDVPVNKECRLVSEGVKFLL